MRRSQKYPPAYDTHPNANPAAAAATSRPLVFSSAIQRSARQTSASGQMPNPTKPRKWSTPASAASRYALPFDLPLPDGRGPR
jgi:hypothetical protein